MLASYYILYVRGVDEEGKPAKLPDFPNVGDKVCHFLGKTDDDEQMKKDKENPFWEKIQDGVRPAWAPDFLRLGYAVVFNREGLPKLAVRLGLRNPKKMKEQEGGRPQTAPTGKRTLTFDDAWVVGVAVDKRPMVMPSTKLSAEEWWLATIDTPQVTSPMIVAGGATVMLGVQRLSDIVSEMLATPQGFPRSTLDPEEDDDYSEFDNPLVPMQLKQGVPHDDKQGQPGEGGGFAAIELFRR